MKKQSIILLHVAIWAIISTVYFFCAETIMAWLVPGVHDVMIWLKTVIAGLVLILVLVSASLVISLRRRAKQVNK